ncbi:MAG: hypothetical protein R3244_02175 [Thermoanaerobaculia bacterium]|nr:hypothetical protein [Thermoanaerobaculia bacterium]
MEWLEWVSFPRIWIPLQIASIVSLWIGSRLTGSPLLMRIGSETYRRKRRAVERVWPLTRLPPALEDGRVATATLILAPAVALKSTVCLAFGGVMVFWLPFAALVVPSILRVHERSEPEFSRWTLTTATLQVTSHSIAAALGFVWTVRWLVSDAGFIEAMSRDPIADIAAGTASLGLAIAAGWLEAVTLERFGL